MTVKAAATAFVFASVALYIGAVLYSRGDAAAIAKSGGLPRPGTVVPPLSGYGRTGKRIPTPGAGCFLIHYSSSDCEHCRAEGATWLDAARHAAAAGCSVQVIVPSVATVPASASDGPAIVFLPLSWAEVVSLRAAPTTILIGRDRSLVWSHVGELDRDSAASLEKAIAAR
ncbi:MAG: hypothetical protein ACREEA_06030 [Stellaceae bacterium]